jgi:hypothetical protein
MRKSWCYEQWQRKAPSTVVWLTQWFSDPCLFSRWVSGSTIWIFAPDSMPPVVECPLQPTTAKIGTAGNGRSVPEARGLTIRHLAQVAAAWLRGTNLARRTIITNYELGKIAEVNWVIVRPVILTDGPKTNAYRALVDLAYPLAYATLFKLASIWRLLTYRPASRPQHVVSTGLRCAPEQTRVILPYNT